MLTISMMSVIFDATTNCVAKLVTDAYAHALASVTRFQVLSGTVTSISTSGALINNTIRKVATIKNFSTHVSANARTTNTSYFLRKNTTNTVITLVYGNLETGLKQDTTNTTTTGAGDIADLAIITLAGTETITVDYHAIEVEHATHGLISASALGTSVDSLPDFGTTRYVAVAGTTQIFSNETHVRQKPRSAFLISESYV